MHLPFPKPGASILSLMESQSIRGLLREGNFAFVGGKSQFLLKASELDAHTPCSWKPFSLVESVVCDDSGLKSWGLASPGLASV